MKHIILYSIFIFCLFSTNQSTAQRYMKFYDQGVEEVEKENFNAALELFSKSIDANSKFPESYFQRSFIYVEKELYSKAIQDLSKAIELAPRNIEFHWARGYLCYYLGYNDQALSDFSSIIEIENNWKTAHFYRGMVYLEKQDFLKAVEDFTIEIENMPSGALIYYNRAIAYDSLNNKELAIDDYSKALQMDSTLVKIYLLRGINYYSSKDYILAIDDLERYYTFGNDTTNCLLYLTMAYYKTDNEVKSEYYFRKALDHEYLLYHGMKGIYDLKEIGYSYNADEEMTLQSIFAKYKDLMELPKTWSVSNVHFSISSYYTYVDFDTHDFAAKKYASPSKKYIEITGNFSHLEGKSKHYIQRAYVSYVENGKLKYSNLTHLKLSLGGDYGSSFYKGKIKNYWIGQKDSKLTLYFEIPEEIKCGISLTFDNLRIVITEPCN